MRLYLALFTVIAFLAVGLLAYKYRGDAIQANAAAERARVDLETAKGVIAANQKAIADLREQAARNAKLAADLQDAMDAANGTMLKLAQNLADLKSRNADVQTYLDQPVPDDLRRMYDR